MEGKEAGLAEALEKGMEKDMEKRNVEIARSMKAKGYTVGDIADIAGLTIEEIETL